MKKGFGKLLLVGALLTGILTGCGGEKNQLKVKQMHGQKDLWK